jgi:uncharacterized phage protein gp47/JayE
MPWSTPTLRQIRSLVRDAIHGSLPGSDATIPNSVLRVLADTQGALCFLTLEYIDWLSLQLLPDTAETEWLDRHGDIWLVNADGTVGRKQATLAVGSVAATGVADSIIPAGSLMGSGIQNATYQVTEMTTVGGGPTPVPVTSLIAGSDGNLEPGDPLNFLVVIPGVDPDVLVIGMSGGADTETDDELRTRILQRIRNPPQGGDQADYVLWALEVPGVTRAWCSPLEMGMGTVTVRFMMDDLRADNGGFPIGIDIDAVTAYLDLKRPVAVKDFFVVAPIPCPLNVTLSNLVTDNSGVRAAIEDSLNAMILLRAAPGVTMWRSWVSSAIAEAPGVDHFELTMDDLVMPNLGSMAVLGDITYV